MVQMGAHDFEYNKVPLYAQKPGNINSSMSAVKTSSCVSKPLLL